MSLTADDVQRVDDTNLRPADRERRIPGEAGAWIFIFGEMAVFALLFGLYLIPRLDEPDVFLASKRELDVTLGAVNAVLLLVSSLLVVAGVAATRRRDRVLAPRLFAAALLFGLGFVVVKYFEYSHHADLGQTVSTNNFWLYYYILTGTHLLHLLIGLGILVYAIVVSRRPRVGTEQVTYVESGACYWHMVDFIWLVLFPLLYLVT